MGISQVNIANNLLSTLPFGIFFLFKGVTFIDLAITLYNNNLVPPILSRYKSNFDISFPNLTGLTVHRFLMFSLSDSGRGCEHMIKTWG